MHRYDLTLIRIAACAVVILLAGAARVDGAQCSISTTPLVFGTYNVFSAAPVDSTGTVSYRCNGGARFLLVTITRGHSVTFQPRELRKGLESLSYNLFRDAARTSVWGDLTDGTAGHHDANPPNNKDVNVTVYGRIPPAQDISAGSYSDTVTVVVNF
jgi:spore coat protein U-like protein